MEGIVELAELEIELTTKEAVKGVVAELGSELAYEKTLREQFHSEALRFEEMTLDLQENLLKEERTKRIVFGVAIGETVLIAGFIAAMFLMN